MAWCLTVQVAMNQAVEVLAAPVPEETWDRLAECESHGQWDYDPETADWGLRLFQGGLQFQPSTWDTFAPEGFPHDAHLASRAEQIAVAERVLDAQGWGAWPVCSLKLGLR